MEEKVLELNKNQLDMLTTIQNNINILQGQLNSGISMAMASANMSDFKIIKVENGKIFYTLENQPAPTDLVKHPS